MMVYKLETELQVQELDGTVSTVWQTHGLYESMASATAKGKYLTREQPADRRSAVAVSDFDVSVWVVWP